MSQIAVEHKMQLGQLLLERNIVTAEQIELEKLSGAVEENQDAISEWTFKNLKIQKGEYRFEPYYQAQGRKYIFPFYVSVKRIDKY